MLDKAKLREQAISKSGLIPRPLFDQLEPSALREGPAPLTLRKHPQQDEGATTGIIPIVTEGEDSTAERDDDRARC